MKARRLRKESTLGEVLLISLLLLTHLTHAQETVHTLQSFLPLQYQPAAPVIDANASLSFFHDQYNVGAGDYIRSNVVNAEYPIAQRNNGYRHFGVGLGFVEKDFGQSDLLKTQQIGLSFASSVRLSSSQFLALGLSGSYVNKRTSLEHLSTGSQWIQDEFRYDPSAGLGEVFTRSQIGYLSLGTGVYWGVNHLDQERFFVSLSAFHLNTPKETFFDEHMKVRITSIFNTGITLLRTERFVLEPQLFYIRSGGNNEYKIVGSAKYLFDNTNPYDLVDPGALELLINFGSIPDISLGLVWHQPNFKIGGSYHLPLGLQPVAIYQSRFQVAVSMGFLTWKKEPPKKVVQQPETRRFEFASPREEGVTSDAGLLELENKLGELDEVKSLQFELMKDFKFQLGKAELMDTNDSFLHELAVMLLANPGYRVKVIGHADDKGSIEANLELSRARAKSVKDHLISKGVSSDQLITLGMGDTQPAVEGDSYAVKAQNRRVEIIIYVERN